MATLENISMFSGEELLIEIKKNEPYLMKYGTPNDTPHYPYYPNLLLTKKPLLHQLPFSDQTEYDRYEICDYQIDLETAEYLSSITQTPVHHILKLRRQFNSLEAIKKFLLENQQERRRVEFQTVPLRLSINSYENITKEGAKAFFTSIKSTNKTEFLKTVGGLVMTYGKNGGELDIFFEEFTVFEAYAIFTMMTSNELSNKVKDLCQQHQVAKKFIESVLNSTNDVEITTFLQATVAVIFICNNLCGIEPEHYEKVFRLIKTPQTISTVATNFIFCLLKLGQQHSVDIVDTLFSPFDYNELSVLVETYPVSLCVIKHLSTLPTLPSYISPNMTPPQRILLSYHLKRINRNNSEIFENSFDYITSKGIQPPSFENPKTYSHTYLLSKLPLPEDNDYLNYFQDITKLLFPPLSQSNHIHQPYFDSLYSSLPLSPHSRKNLFRFLNKVCIMYPRYHEYLENVIHSEIKMRKDVFKDQHRTKYRYNQFLYTLHCIQSSPYLIKFILNSQPHFYTPLIQYLYGCRLQIFPPQMYYSNKSIEDFVGDIVSTISAKYPDEVGRISYHATTPEFPLSLVASSKKVLLIHYNRSIDHNFDRQCHIFSLTFTSTKGDNYVFRSGVFNCETTSDNDNFITISRVGGDYIIYGTFGKRVVDKSYFELFAQGAFVSNKMDERYIPMLLVFERIDIVEMDNDLMPPPQPSFFSLSRHNIDLPTKDLELSKLFVSDEAFINYQFEKCLGGICHYGKVNKVQNYLLKLQKDDREGVLFSWLNMINELFRMTKITENSPSILQHLNKFMKVIDQEDILFELAGDINNTTNFKSLVYLNGNDSFCSIICDIYVLLSKYKSPKSYVILSKFLLNLKEITPNEVQYNSKPTNVILNKLNQFELSSYELFIKCSMDKYLFKILPSMIPIYQHEKINTTAILHIISKMFTYDKPDVTTSLERINSIEFNDSFVKRFLKKLNYMIKNTLDAELLLVSLEKICNYSADTSKNVIISIISDIDFSYPAPTLLIISQLLQKNLQYKMDVVFEIIRSDNIQNIKISRNESFIKDITEFIVTLYNAGGSDLKEWWNCDELLIKARDVLTSHIERKNKVKEYLTAYPKQELINLFHSKKLDPSLYSKRYFNIFISLIEIIEKETNNGNKFFIMKDYGLDKASLILLNAKINRCRLAQKHHQKRLQELNSNSFKPSEFDSSDGLSDIATDGSSSDF